mgnify:CR=1 FL=1|jgi:hypothetical protein|tara:strand:- start:125 stop:589 length:465 start_codon:yes stop_codon:yes gene_type:complete
MSWELILKKGALKEVKQILDFVKNDMRKELGEHEMQDPTLYEVGELTEQIASDILYLLKEGKSSPYSQIDDERNGTEVDVYIDDGFDFRIMSNPKKYFGEEEFGFAYNVQHNLYERLREGETTPEKVEAIIDKFLQMIGRTGMEHGLTVEYLSE